MCCVGICFAEEQKLVVIASRSTHAQSWCPHIHVKDLICPKKCRISFCIYAVSYVKSTWIITGQAQNHMILIYMDRHFFYNGGSGSCLQCICYILFNNLVEMKKIMLFLRVAPGQEIQCRTDHYRLKRTLTEFWCII